jgi:PBP1b-binding outer membrane lipoprotein LpoB
MKIFELSIIVLVIATLAGCSFGSTSEDTVTATPDPVTTPAAATATATPVESIAETTAESAAAASTPVPANRQESVQAFTAHIDASAFLNALVDSGCQIDKAEYKEVKRGGAIKVVCSKSIDALNVELEDL